MLQAEKKKFIEFMMSADVLRFGSFVTKSGRHTPYFVNTGNYRTGAQISALGGPAYKGIPLVSSAAGALARNHGIDKPFFFNRKEAKDHGEGGCLVGYRPKDSDRIIIIEDVITAGTAIREVIPILTGCAKVTVSDMFISVNRCEVGQTPGTTAVMEVKEDFGIDVHAIVTVRDIYEYLKEQQFSGDMLAAMEKYMSNYCI